MKEWEDTQVEEDVRNWIADCRGTGFITWQGITHGKKGCRLDVRNIVVIVVTVIAIMMC